MLDLERPRNEARQLLACRLIGHSVAGAETVHIGRKLCHDELDSVLLHTVQAQPHEVGLVILFPPADFRQDGGADECVQLIGGFDAPDLPAPLHENALDVVRCHPVDDRVVNDGLDQNLESVKNGWFHVCGRQQKHQV